MVRCGSTYTGRRTVKGELGLDLIGRFIVVLAAVSLGVLFLTNQASQTEPRESIQIVQQSSYPICGDYRAGDRVDRQEFESLVYARYIENCAPGNTTVVADFVLAQDYLDDYVRSAIGTDDDGDPLVVRTETCEPIDGFDGIVSAFTNETIAFRPGTRMNISSTRGGEVSICPAG